MEHFWWLPSNVSLISIQLTFGPICHIQYIDVEKPFIYVISIHEGLVISTHNVSNHHIFCVNMGKYAYIPSNT